MIFGSKYQTKSLIGQGSFGKIYDVRVLEKLQPPRFLVVKVERRSRNSRLPWEHKIYLKLQGLPCIAKVYFFGEHNRFYGLVMDNVGLSLQQLFQVANLFPLEPCELFVALLMEKMIEAVKSIHSLGIIHNDLKPHNIMLDIDVDENSRITLIDFGGSTVEGESNGVSSVGNAYFASTRLLRCHDAQPTRIDDLISLGYILIYLANGCTMTWDPLYNTFTGNNTDSTWEEWLSFKEQTSPELLGRGLPILYSQFLSSILCLGSDDIPEYDQYMEDFRSFVATLDD